MSDEEIQDLFDAEPAYNTTSRVISSEKSLFEGFRDVKGTVRYRKKISNIKVIIV